MPPGNRSIFKPLTLGDLDQDSIINIVFHLNHRDASRLFATWKGIKGVYKPPIHTIREGFRECVRQSPSSTTIPSYMNEGEQGLPGTFLAQLKDGRIVTGNHGRDPRLDTAGVAYVNHIGIWDETASNMTHALHGEYSLTLAAGDVVELSDGRLATRASEKTIVIWDLNKDVPGQGHGQRLAVEGGGVDYFMELKGGRIAVVTRCTIKIWDPSKGEEDQGHWQVWEGFTGLVNSITELKGQRIAVGTTDAIKIWDPSKGKNEQGYCQVVEEGTGWIASVIELKDGRIAAISMSADDYAIRIWDPSKKRGEAGAYQVLEVHEGAVSSCIQLKDGRIASGGKDGRIRIWDPSKGEDDPDYCLVLDGHSGAEDGSTVWDIIELEDGRIASVGYSIIRIWDLSKEIGEAGYCQVIEVETSDGFYIEQLKDGRILSVEDKGPHRIWGMR